MVECQLSSVHQLSLVQRLLHLSSNVSLGIADVAVFAGVLADAFKIIVGYSGQYEVWKIS